MDTGLEAYKKRRYILLAFKEGCPWYNFTDDWNAQIGSKAATKFLRKHMQKWKIKSLFKALSLTIVLKRRGNNKYCRKLPEIPDLFTQIRPAFSLSQTFEDY